MKSKITLMSVCGLLGFVAVFCGACGAPATVEYNADRTEAVVSAPCDASGYPNSECMMRGIFIKLAKEVYEAANSTQSLERIKVMMICKVDRKDEYGNAVKFDNPQQVAFLTDMAFIRKFADAQTYAERVSERRNGVWVYSSRSH